jgi:hypothetical protein
VVVQGQLPEICIIPGVLWPAIYGKYCNKQIRISACIFLTLLTYFFILEMCKAYYINLIVNAENETFHIVNV